MALEQNTGITQDMRHRVIELVGDLKHRVVRLVDAIDMAKGLTMPEKENLASVVGSLTVVINCMDAALSVENGLEELGASETIQIGERLVGEVDEVLADIA